MYLEKVSDDITNKIYAVRLSERNITLLLVVPIDQNMKWNNVFCLRIWQQILKHFKLWISRWYTTTEARNVQCIDFTSCSERKWKNSENDLRQN